MGADCKSKLRHYLCVYFYECSLIYNDLTTSVCFIFNNKHLCFRSMSLRTLSMLGSRVSTPRYGTLNSHRDFQTGLAAESRTLDRSHISTIDRSLHIDRSRNGFERATSVENSQPQSFERMLSGEGRSTPVTSPVSFHTFYTQQQQQQQQTVRNGGTRDLYSPPKNSHASRGYVDMNHRGITLACLLEFVWNVYLIWLSWFVSGIGCHAQ